MSRDQKTRCVKSISEYTHASNCICKPLFPKSRMQMWSKLKWLFFGGGIIFDKHTGNAVVGWCLFLSGLEKVEDPS